MFINFRRRLVAYVRRLIKREVLQVMMKDFSGVLSQKAIPQNASNNSDSKGFLFCTAYFNNPSRYRDWIKYYNEHKEQLNIAHLFLIDDASDSIDLGCDVPIISADNPLPSELREGVYVVTFKQHLGRKSLGDYSGWWRSFCFSITLAETYNFSKIIHIESDFYVLSSSLFNYISDLQSGWTTFWSAQHHFPETAIQVICKDQFNSFYNVAAIANKEKYCSLPLAEHALPFTHIETAFNGDRLGEDIKGNLKEIIRNKYDYVGQIQNTEVFFTYYQQTKPEGVTNEFN